MRAPASCEAWARSRLSPSPTARFTPHRQQHLRNRVVELDEVVGQLEGDAAMHEAPQLGGYSLGFLLPDSSGAHKACPRFGEMKVGALEGRRTSAETNV